MKKNVAVQQVGEPQTVLLLWPAALPASYQLYLTAAIAVAGAETTAQEQAAGYPLHKPDQLHEGPWRAAPVQQRVAILA